MAMCKAKALERTKRNCTRTQREWMDSDTWFAPAPVQARQRVCLTDLPQNAVGIKDLTDLTSTEQDEEVAVAHYYITRVLQKRKSPSDIVLQDVPFSISRFLEHNQTNPTVMALLHQMPNVVFPVKQAYVQKPDLAYELVKRIYGNLPINVEAIDWDQMVLYDIYIAVIHCGTPDTFDAFMSCENPVRSMILNLGNRCLHTELLARNHALLEHILGLDNNTFGSLVHNIRAHLVSYSCLKCACVKDIKWVMKHLGVQDDVCVALLQRAAEMMDLPMFKYLTQLGFGQ